MREQKDKNSMDEKFSTQDIYKLVNDTRVELSTHILRLEGKFDTLEAGRVSTLEKDLAEIKARQEPVQKIVYGLVGFVLLTVLGAVLALVIINK